MTDDIRYPVGPCVWSAELSAEEKRQHLRDIAEMRFPEDQRQRVADAVPELETHNGVLAQRAVPNLERGLVGSERLDSLQRE